jgi:DHA1 family multidrug resistance protein-like MFS transporter
MEIWRKNLYVLCGTQFLGMMAMNLVVPFLPFYLRELGVTNPDELARWSGLVFAGPFMTAFIATPFWGALGDRHGRRLMVIRALFGLTISQLLIGFAQDVVQIFLFRLLQGALSGFIAATLALVSTSTPRERIGYALGLLQSSTAAGTVIGPFVGGLLADLIGYREIFFIVAALCFTAGIVVIKNVQETTAVITDKMNIFTPFHNMRLLVSDKHLRVVALTLILAQTSVQMIEPIFALFIESFAAETRFLSTLTGGIFAIAGVFMVFSAPWWGKRNDRLGFKRNLLMALTGTGVAYSFHLIVPNLFALTGLRALLGFARGGVVPALYSLTNLHAPSDRKSGMIGIASSITILGNMVGPIIGGMIGGHLGVRACFAFTGGLLFLTTLIVWKYLIEVQNVPSPHSEEKLNESR